MHTDDELTSRVGIVGALGSLARGRARVLTVALEQTVEPIEFTREPAKEMFERDFLEQAA